MRAVVTGAGGLIGATIVRRTGWAGLSHRDLDITDERAVASLDAGLIVNCAVIGVDECEENPSLARAINVEGPRNLARVAPRFIHFSSNYAIDPVNVYGRTKLEGEHAVLEANPRALVVRTSWVFGRGKNSFLSTAPSKLARGERITAISDTFASATYVEDLVTALLSMIDSSGLHALVNEGVLSYLDFAREAARIVGASESLIDVVSESRLRPRYTPMISSVPMRSWREALSAYLRDEGIHHRDHRGHRDSL